MGTFTDRFNSAVATHGMRKRATLGSALTSAGAKAFYTHAAPAVAGGVVSNLSSSFYDTPWTFEERALPTAVGVGAGLLSGNKLHSTMTKGRGMTAMQAFTKGKAWVPMTGGALAEAGVSPLMLYVRGALNNQRLDKEIKSIDLDHLKNPPKVQAPAAQDLISKIPGGKGTLLAAAVAGGVLTAAGAYSLYQFGRAAKNVGDGKPLSTSNTVVSGGGDTSSAGSSAGGKGGGGGGDLGTLRVTLPTKNPGDRETQVEMPLERIGLSNALLSKIKRDTKRRLRGETELRTKHIEPKPAVVPI